MLCPIKNVNPKPVRFKNKYKRSKPLSSLFHLHVFNNHVDHIVLVVSSSLRNNIAAKQQILATIDDAKYLASRKETQKVNIQNTVKDLVRILSIDESKMNSLVCIFIFVFVLLEERIEQESRKN
jgi:hypothetical protein